MLLSYPLNDKTPAYGDGEKFQITPCKQMANGDSCNTEEYLFSNHMGTHIDGPAHFSKEGKRITDYSDDFWRCDKIQILALELADAELCSAEHFQKAWDESPMKQRDAEMVILFTGWFQKRYQESYWKTPPGFLPETSEWLRSTFPKIRFFGFDLISLSSFAHRDIGGSAHRAFLDNDSPILIIEDMDLSALAKGSTLKNVLVSPLFVSNADGAPCTVWANL